MNRVGLAFVCGVICGLAIAFIVGATAGGSSTDATEQEAQPAFIEAYDVTVDGLPLTVLDDPSPPVEGWRDVTPEDKTTGLIAAILDRQPQLYIDLLDAGADPNEWDQYGRNAVIVAAGVPNSQFWLRYALAHGGDPAACAPESIRGQPLLNGGFAPLHSACQVRENQLNVRVLVESGIDVNAKNAYGMTPLGLAVEAGLYGIAEYLVDHGADASMKMTGGFVISHQLDFLVSEENALVLSPEDAADLDRLRDKIRAVSGTE